MSTLFGSAGGSTQPSTTGDLSKDVALTSPPEDGISDLAFSPVSEHLAVSSWDKKVRIYEINDQGQSEGKALFEHEAPVLSCCWSPVSTCLLSYSCGEASQVLGTDRFFARMVPKSLEPAQTRLRVCWTSAQAPLPRNK